MLVRGSMGAIYLNYWSAASIDLPVLLALTVLGLILGSFYNVLIYRLPRGIFWRYRRSHCPHCQAKIPFYLNVPVISFVWLAGKSHCCQHRLSWHYPLIELASAILLVGLYLYFPFISDEGVLEQAQLMRFLHAYLFASFLLIGSVIDLYHMIIPDEITLTLVALTPAVIYLHPELDWLSSIIGVVVGGGSLYAIAWLYWLTRRKIGMGMGDVKLLAGIGGWLGYQGVLTTLLYGSLIGTFVALILIFAGKKGYNMQSALPFGPCLALGALLHLLCGQSLLRLLFWV